VLTVEAGDERQRQKSQMQGDSRTQDQVGNAVARKSSGQLNGRRL
jgi:hypothetical protein